MAEHFEEEARRAEEVIAMMAAERAMLLKAAGELRRGPRRKPARPETEH